MVKTQFLQTSDIIHKAILELYYEVVKLLLLKLNITWETECPKEERMMVDDYDDDREEYIGIGAVTRKLERKSYTSRVILYE